MSNLSSSTAPKKETNGKEDLLTQLLANVVAENVPEEGAVIDGKVVAISKGEVLVDYGGKAEGVVQGRELSDRTVDEEPLEIGSDVLAIVLLAEDEEGRAVLSIRRARAERKWREMQKKFEDKTPVSVIVVQPNKGGLIVNAEGLQGFVPISQLGPEHYPSSIQKGPGFADAAIAYLTSFVGEEFSAQIIEFERQTNRLILSERVLLQQTQGLKPLDELDFKIGDSVQGKVVAIKDFGVFIDLGTTSGLVHISEMSWDRVNHPGDLVKVGQDLKVRVIGIEEGGRRVSLSIKRLLDNPWAKVASKYHIDQVVKGQVTKIVDYGAFVQIEPGFDGLVHISELSSFHVKDPADVLQEGQESDFKIILLDIDEQRLGLSFKQANPEALIEPETGEPLPVPPGEQVYDASSIIPDGVPAAQVKPEQKDEPVVESQPDEIKAAPAKPEPVAEAGPEIGPAREDALKIIMGIEGVGPATAERLYDAGYQTLDQIKAATISQLSLVHGLRRNTAEKIIEAAAKVE